MIDKYTWVVAGPSRAGKTTLINEVAAITNLIPIDMDVLITNQCNLTTVKESYSYLGENKFSQLELKTYQSFTPRAGQIIALGGGVLLNEKIASLTKQWGIIGNIEHSKEMVLQRWAISAPRNIHNKEVEYNKRQNACSLWSKRIWSSNVNDFIQQITKIAEAIKSG